MLDVFKTRKHFLETELVMWPSEFSCIGLVKNGKTNKSHTPDLMVSQSNRGQPRKRNWING